MSAVPTPTLWAPAWLEISLDRHVLRTGRRVLLRWRSEHVDVLTVVAGAGADPSVPGHLRDSEIDPPRSLEVDARPGSGLVSVQMTHSGRIRVVGRRAPGTEVTRLSPPVLVLTAPVRGPLEHDVVRHGPDTRRVLAAPVGEEPTPSSPEDDDPPRPRPFPPRGGADDPLTTFLRHCRADDARPRRRRG